ncbi:hypothetical protein L1047_09850 [Synechococcus sp. Nb3U1]|uniref:hypothetical protein n=1 Tax=Synechococcus sp. Nb3U1 TaxID=1914529 RepID=UPI001F288594|nr:hypothetical protein [Synechococcus sp. Nb3U1]MCF2971496.1 hypothetical protein [Synechococcus sp. Nb3U1]
MNLRPIFARALVGAALSGLALSGSALAQANLRELPPDLAEQLTTEQILQACASNQADTLPSPFPDVVPSDWAYKAVLTLYYCGAYRGAIPPEQYQRYLEQQRGSQT